MDGMGGFSSVVAHEMMDVCIYIHTHAYTLAELFVSMDASLVHFISFRRRRAGLPLLPPPRDHAAAAAVPAAPVGGAGRRSRLHALLPVSE